MMEWITLNIINEINVWIVVAVVVGLACIAIAIYVPPIRGLMFAVGGVILAAAAFYAKGVRDQRELEKKKRDSAVKKVTDKYDKIDKRKTKPGDVEKRLKDGTF
jgi:hypothetical protein